MSAYGAEFLRDLDLHVGIEGLETPNVNFTPQGYLFLATEKGAETLQSNSKLQKLVIFILKSNWLTLLNTVSFKKTCN